MKRYYSRRASTEERKNVRSAVLFVVATFALIFVLFFFGHPLLAKFAGFLTDLRKSSLPVETTDTTPPPPPKFSDLPESTNQRSVDIKGSTEPGAEVILTLNGNKDELVANADGTFTYTFLLQGGSNTIYATAKDGSGNVSQESETIRVKYDNSPPELTITKPDDGSSFYGSRQRQLVIEGKTEEDAHININGRLVVVNSDGSFTYATSLSTGENSFTVKAQDPAGNLTEISFKVTFSE